MPLDSIFLAHLVHELDTQLQGARVDKIHQPSRNEITMALRTASGNLRLLVSANQNNPRIQITPESYENPTSPPMFCMLLRKHLQGAKILQVEQIPFERVCKIHFDTNNEMGDKEIKTLVLEMMGRASNLIFLSCDQRIIVALSYIDISEEKSRQLIPGILYEPPKKQEKFLLSEALGEVKERILDAKDTLPADQFLLNHIAGFSPLLARECAFLATGTTDKHMVDLDPLEKLDIFRAVSDTVFQTDGKAPTMLVAPDDTPSDFTFMPILQYGDLRRSVSYTSYSDLLNRFYATRDRAAKMKTKSTEIHRLVQNLISRTAKKLHHQEVELSGFQKREQYRIFGELLTANLHRIQSGDSSCTVEDYYSEDLAQVTIPLDVTKNPSANAALYFKKFQKAKNGEKILLTQMEKGREELLYLESVAHSITQVETEKDISQIREELMDSGYIRPEKNGRNKKIPEVSGIKELIVDDFTVYIGRNNKQNDYIISKLGRAEDYWLHTLNIPGSHVLIKCGTAEVGESTMTKVAELAAFYSKASGNKNVPVTYTKLKYVKKPNGAKAGFVIFTTSKTAFVDGSKKENG